MRLTSSAETIVDFNIAAVHDAVAAARPDREVVVQGEVRRTAAELADRTMRLARVLLGAGIGGRAERDGLAGHESGQDHLALYLHDTPEYLEGMVGAYKARVAPFNVNYRYVAEELRYVLRAGKARGVVYHGAFTPRLAEVLPDLPGIDVLIRVDDGSGHPLLPGAVDYEEALRGAPAEGPALTWSPDDLYILFTGGTTGRPKGVLWRQADIIVAGLAVVGDDGREWESLSELVAATTSAAARRILVAAPLMHASGQWAALWALLCGGTAVLPTTPDRRDPTDLLSTMERERTELVTIVGDAFGRPLVEELRRGRYDLSALRAVLTGGAPLSAPVRAELLELLPQLAIIDSVGSSESGPQARAKTSPTTGAMPPGSFRPRAGTVVIDESRSRVLPPGHDGIGWLASSGRIPLGYLGDPDGTARTFPLVGGVRMAVPGDRARHRADGIIELLGREAATINSGGEKIFAEEVEAALLAHESVTDAVVVGRPSERWGQEVAAVVSLRPGRVATVEELLATAGQRLARYKLPKHVVVVEQVKRSPVGKADYAWARRIVTAEPVETASAAGDRRERC